MKRIHSLSRTTARTGIAALAALLLAGSQVPALAHGGHTDAAATAAPVKEQKPWGIAGDARRATRTVDVDTLDTMRFSPERIDARRGETLRIRVHNRGQVMHEFVIGTKASNAEHAEMMLKHPGMEHDEPYMAHVPPGESRDLVWQFNRDGEFEYACLIAGHYQAGMVGTLRVQGASAAKAAASAAKPPASSHKGH
ncbi:MAG: cupredoxin family protein [Burkholderiales bacterium]|nr:cupredoxin family protein [Burkholderiales bacterium]